MSKHLRKHHLAGRDGKLGISVSTLDRMVKNGQFPRPVALSSRTVGWPSDVVERWQATRPEKGGAPMSPAKFDGRTLGGGAA